MLSKLNFYPKFQHQYNNFIAFWYFPQIPNCSVSALVSRKKKEILFMFYIHPINPPQGTGCHANSGLLLKSRPANQ